MEQIKLMASPKAAKAYVAALLALISAATVAAPNGFTFAELLTIVGAAVVTFQATYWTSNAKTAPDGSIDVATVSGVKTYSLNLDSDPATLDTKDQVVFKVNS